MRKFRGKRKDNGEWVYGWYILENGLHGIMTQAKTKAVLIWNDVIPETVGQFTGLKDKNGKEGYFDDIVKDEGDRYIVQWDDDDGVAYLKAILESSFDLSIVAIKAREIIGSIHTHPELLKGESQ